MHLACPTTVIGIKITIEATDVKIVTCVFLDRDAKVAKNEALLICDSLNSTNYLINKK